MIALPNLRPLLFPCSSSGSRADCRSDSAAIQARAAYSPSTLPVTVIGVLGRVPEAPVTVIGVLGRGPEAPVTVVGVSGRVPEVPVTVVGVSGRVPEVPVMVVGVSGRVPEVPMTVILNHAPPFRP